MAKLAKRQRSKEMTHWYHNVLRKGSRMPPTSSEKHGLTRSEVARYRKVVAQEQALHNWSSLRLGLEGEKIQRDVFCEHCLRYKAVLLVTPGIVSDHMQGDFVCADCHPQVAMLMLDFLVFGESA